MKCSKKTVSHQEQEFLVKVKMDKIKIYPHELIGKEMEVIKARNKFNIGIKGKIVDETKSTLKVEQGGKIKTLLKKNVMFRLCRTGQVIDGKTIAKKSEERIK